jgi:hypothetical protein
MKKTRKYKNFIRKLSLYIVYGIKIKKIPLSNNCILGLIKSTRRIKIPKIKTRSNRNIIL